MGKSVHGQIPAEGVEGADEDDVGGVQIFVFFSFFQQLHINHGLVKTTPFGQPFLRELGTLHLDIVYSALFISHIDIQSDPLAGQSQIDCFFKLLIVEFLDGNLQDFLNQMLTQAGISQDTLEHEVIQKC